MVQALEGEEAAAGSSQGTPLSFCLSFREKGGGAMNTYIALKITSLNEGGGTIARCPR